MNHFWRKNVVNQSAAVWPLYARSEGRLIRQARQSRSPLLYLSASVSLSASTARAAKQQHCDFQLRVKIWCDLCVTKAAEFWSSALFLFPNYLAQNERERSGSFWRRTRHVYPPGSSKPWHYLWPIIPPHLLAEPSLVEYFNPERNANWWVFPVRGDLKVNFYFVSEFAHKSSESVEMQLFWRNFSDKVKV